VNEYCHILCQASGNTLAGGQALQKKTCLHQQTAVWSTLCFSVGFDSLLPQIYSQILFAFHVFHLVILSICYKGHLMVTVQVCSLMSEIRPEDIR